MPGICIGKIDACISGALYYGLPRSILLTGDVCVISTYIVTFIFCDKNTDIISQLVKLSTMTPNKRNMLLETVACLSLFTGSDVTQGERLTSELNEHTFGIWHMILREFNMEQLICIVQKAIIKKNAIFESDFDALKSNAMKGYPAGLQSFIHNMKKGSSTGGPIDVDLSKPAVNQLLKVSFCLEVGSCCLF